MDSFLRQRLRRLVLVIHGSKPMHYYYLDRNLIIGTSPRALETGIGNSIWHSNLELLPAIHEVGRSCFTLTVIPVNDQAGRW
jgi:hypothetical protein